MRETQNLFLDTCILKDSLISVKQNDSKSRFLKIQVSANEEILDLTNSTVCVYCKKQDGAVVFSQAEFLDAQNGLVEVELSSGFLSATGEVLCELKIYSANNTLLSSMPFTIRVIGAISEDEAIEATDDFSALTEAISKVSVLGELAIDIENTLENVDTSLSDVNEKMNVLDEKLSLASQIILNSIPDKIVTPTKMADAKVNVFDKTKASQGYINDSGVITESVGVNFYSSDFIPVSPLQKYTISAGSGRGYAYYDENFNFISRTQIDTYVGAKATITIDDDESIKYMRLQMEESTENEFLVDDFMIYFGDDLPECYVEYGATIDWLNTPIDDKSIKNNHIDNGAINERTLKNSGINVFNLQTASKGYIDQSGLIDPDIELDIYTSDYIRVYEGEKYTLSAGSCRGFAYYDENKNYIENSRVQIDNGYGGDRTIEIPQNSTYIRIQIEDKPELEYFIQKFMVCLGETLPNHFMPYGVEANWIRPYNRLKSKTMLVFGDSIMAANPADENTHVYGMFEQIADQNSMTLYNKAVNGATMLISASSNNNIYAQVTSDNTPTTGVDYIFLNGGLNDIIHQSIGSVTALYNEEIVENTFCGGFEKTLRALLLTYPRAEIYYLTTHKIPGATYLETYMNKAKEICKKYSIPVIDLFSSSGICTEIEDSAEGLFLSNASNEFDAVHPNTLGYEKLAKRILDCGTSGIDGKDGLNGADGVGVVVVENEATALSQSLNDSNNFYIWSDESQENEMQNMYTFSGFNNPQTTNLNIDYSQSGVDVITESEAE